MFEFETATGTKYSLDDKAQWTVHLTDGTRSSLLEDVVNEMTEDWLRTELSPADGFPLVVVAERVANLYGAELAAVGSREEEEFQEGVEY